jgi:hypothetical protein
MNDFLELLCVFALGWFLGQKFLIYSMRKIVEQHAKDLGIDLDAEEQESLPPRCVIEKHGEQLYLYDKDTNDFYCQAYTLEALAEALYNNRKIDLASITIKDKKVWFVKGKISNTVQLNES